MTFLRRTLGSGPRIWSRMPKLSLGGSAGLKRVATLFGGMVLWANVALAAPPEVVADSTSVVSGMENPVIISVRSDRPASELRSFASAGTLEGPRVESERLLFSWIPPKIRVPMVAILLFWNETDGAPELAALRIRFFGRTELEVDTEGGASVVVEVGSSSFGPVLADKSGKVKVPIEVPPDTRSVTVVAQTKSRKTSRSVPLEVPATNPLASLITPQPVVRDRGAWLVVVHATELPLADLDIDSRGGQLKKRGASKDHALFYILPDAEAEELTATSTLRGNPVARSTAQAPVFVPPPPLRAPPPPPPPPRPPKSEVEPSRQPGLIALLAGAFYSSGDSRGVQGDLTGAYRLPWLKRRIAMGASLGLRGARSSATVLPLGNLTSSLSALPVDLVIQGVIADLGSFELGSRIGVGPMFVRHSVTSDFQASFDETFVSFDAWVGLSLAYRFKVIDVLLELREAYSPASTPHLDAQLGGLMASLGVRRDLP